MKLALWPLLLLPLLTRQAQAAPANDNFGDAQTISGITTTVTTSTTGATAEESEPNHNFELAHASVWFRWTPQDSGFTTISTAGSDYDTILAVYTGSSLTELTRIASNDDDNAATSKVNFVNSANTTYYIAVDGYEGETGNLKLTLNSLAGVTAPANDFYTNAIFLPTTPISLTTSNYLAATEPGELTPTANGGASLWWLWQAPADGYFIVSTSGSDFDTILSVYRGTNLVSWNDDQTPGKTSKVRFYARQDVRYHISVQGYRAAMGVVQLSLIADPPKPMPAWDLVELSDQTIHSTNFLGKVVFLDVWATWCGPCVDEVPTLIDMQNKYGPDGLVIIGVSTDEEGFQVVAPFVTEHGVNYLSTISNTEFAQNYGSLEFIPTALIFNRDGLLTDKLVGSYPQKTLEEAILPLLYASIPVQADREGTNLVMRWSAAYKGYQVQAATSMNPPNWTNTFSTITVSGENNQARLPLNGPARYFRLVHN